MVFPRISTNTHPSHFIGMYRVVFQSPYSQDEKAIAAVSYDDAVTLDKINKQGGYTSRVETWDQGRQEYAP